MMCEALKVLRNRLGSQVRDVSLKHEDKLITVSGTVKRFYIRQVIYTTLSHQYPDCRVVDEIKVRENAL